MDRKEELRRAINSLSSQICRAKKAGEDTTSLEARRSALQAEKKNLKGTVSLPKIKIAAPKKTAKVRVSRTPNKVGATMDKAAIERAIDELGITTPIVVKWSNGRRRIGCTRFRGDRLFGNQEITITVSNQIVKPEKTSETIWHELTHAKQMEEYSNGSDFGNEYRRHGYTGNAYKRNPYEVEARVTADEKVSEGKLLVTGADEAKMLLVGGTWADRLDIDPQSGVERRVEAGTTRLFVR